MPALVATLGPRSAHSSSGLGHRPLTAAARVRIPYGPFRSAWLCDNRIAARVRGVRRAANAHAVPTWVLPWRVAGRDNRFESERNRLLKRQRMAGLAATDISEAQSAARVLRTMRPVDIPGKRALETALIVAYSRGFTKSSIVTLSRDEYAPADEGSRALITESSVFATAGAPTPTRTRIAKFRFSMARTVRQPSPRPSVQFCRPRSLSSRVTSSRRSGCASSRRRSRSMSSSATCSRWLGDATHLSTVLGQDSATCAKPKTQESSSSSVYLDEPEPSPG